MRTVLVAGVVSFVLSSSPGEAEGADPVPPRTLRTRIAAKLKPGKTKPNLITRSVTRLRDGDPRQLDRAGLDALAARRELNSPSSDQSDSSVATSRRSTASTTRRTTSTFSCDIARPVSRSAPRAASARAARVRGTEVSGMVWRAPHRR